MSRLLLEFKDETELEQYKDALRTEGKTWHLDEICSKSKLIKGVYYIKLDEFKEIIGIM